MIFTIMMAFWLLISASVHWQHILVGFIFCTIITLFWNSMAIAADIKTGFSLRQLYLLVKYFFYLAIDIVRANISVAMIVLHPKMPITPGIIIMRCDLERSLSRVLYVNSITLTPGTITVELEENLLIVHALTEEAAKDVEDWALYRRLMEVEALYKK